MRRGENGRVADLVRFEALDGHVALVTLDRPEKRNAVNAKMAVELDACVKRAEADPEIRAVVLASSNDRVFCAGADLADLAAGRGADLFTRDGGFAGFVYHPRRKPWVAAPQGTTVAGGLEICLACDMIVAADSCLFGLPEVARGLVAAAGGVTRLPRAIPRAIAIEIVATGQPIDAARAYALGLVNRVVPSERTVEAALELARIVAANAPLAVQEAVALARQAATVDEATGRGLADEALARVSRTEDFREGPGAFVEKRAPRWTGR